MIKKISKGGFSLVEILLALLILGIGIVTLFNLFPLGFQALAYSRRLNEVSLLAQKKMEELKSQNALLEEGENSGEEGNLKWRISTKPLQIQGGPEVFLVELNIDFDFQGKSQTQKFVTYLSQNK
ncbi:MAG: prepilin-type N-terminal cleavage/methylation domain-containing protein [Candidatus Omnitrophica bacterium]|nr:prepilin-type N-terminal cleavage/methylation domain-containing protein [Candidatus Omnitrophota bacterium]